MHECLNNFISISYGYRAVTYEAKLCQENNERQRDVGIQTDCFVAALLAIVALRKRLPTITLLWKTTLRVLRQQGEANCLKLGKT